MFSEVAFVVASAAGRLQDASPFVRESVEVLAEANEEAQLSSRVAYLAHIEHERGRFRGGGGPGAPER